MCIAPLIVALKVGVYVYCPAYSCTQGWRLCALPAHWCCGELKVDAFENAFLTKTILTLFNLLLLLKEITESQLQGDKKISRRQN
jgi:hypothetical protein